MFFPSSVCRDDFVNVTSSALRSASERAMLFAFSEPMSVPSSAAITPLITIAAANATTTTARAVIQVIRCGLLFCFSIAFPLLPSGSNNYLFDLRPDHATGRTIVNVLPSPGLL